MENTLKEFGGLSGDIIFAFVGYDNWEDFFKIMQIVKDNLQPEECEYGGFTDMKGYIVKNGIRLDVQYDSMVGNGIFYKGEHTEPNLTQVRKWVKLIFEKMEL